MFITFEGIEGSSKTTQAGLLSEWLTEIGVDNLLTKEPGSVLSRECQDIRRVLLSPENDLDSRAELFLYLADRAQHIDKCIYPALMKGKCVISDRFSLSTHAYQGYGREHRFLGQSDWFRQALDIAAYNVKPDMIFLMDLPVEVGLQRAKSSNTEFEGGDRMEREALEFHQTLRDGFLEIVEDYDEGRYVILNAEKSIEELHAEVKGILKPKIERWQKLKERS